MQHLFLNKELSLTAKEKGFKEKGLAFYGGDDMKLIRETDDIYPNRNVEFPEWGQITAPLYQQIIDWFREKHNWHIEVIYKQVDRQFRGFIYPIQPNTRVHICGHREDYYQALDKAIEEAFKLI